VRPAARSIVPGGRSFVPACVCRRAARKGAVKAGRSAALPLASVLPGHALYEAFQVKRYFTAFFTFFIPGSLFDLDSRFFAPTHTCWKSTRAGAVKAGRRSALALGSIVSRPSLDSLEHVGTLVVVGMTRPRGASLSGHDGLAPQPCIRWIAVTRTMMHACASAASSEVVDPFLTAARRPWRGTDPTTSNCHRASITRERLEEDGISDAE